MGMGEPAHNLDNVMRGDRAARHLRRHRPQEPRVLHRRRSARVRAAAGEGPVRPALALSLHTTKCRPARATLLPRAPRYRADRPGRGRAQAYARATGYPIQYQWTLIEGVNDGDDELEAIVALLAGQYAVMNFIPFNAVRGPALMRGHPWSGERAEAMARCICTRRGDADEAAAVGGAGRGRRLRAAARARRVGEGHHEDRSHQSRVRLAVAASDRRAAVGRGQVRGPFRSPSSWRTR